MPTIGYGETVTEAEWSDAFRLAGASGVVANIPDWKVTRVSGVRRVQIAPGTGFAVGIQEIRGSAASLDLPQPRGVNGQPSVTVGQWFMVVAAYERASGSVTFEALAGPTTSTTTPTLAPSPSQWPTLQRTANDFQQPLAWCWVHPTDVARSADFDLRTLPNRVPAGLTSNGIWRYSRGGNTQDNASAGTAIDYRTSGDSITRNVPLGIYRIDVDVVLSSSSGSATNVLTLTVNGSNLRVSRRDLDVSLQTQTIGDTFLHPGGDLTWSVAFSTTLNPATVYRAGTVATLTWERNPG